MGADLKGKEEWKMKKLEKSVCVCVGGLLDTDTEGWLEWLSPSRPEKEQGSELSGTCRCFEKSGPSTCE